MSRIRPTDIIVELTELCEDVMDEVRQQLLYYRASVYKDETGTLIRRKIDHLRLIANILGDDLAKEPFRDYDAMEIAKLPAAHGECSLSKRIALLLQEFSKHLQSTQRQTSIRDPKSHAAGGPDLARSVQRHRRELLAICRQGSRQWAFFQSI